MQNSTPTPAPQPPVPPVRITTQDGARTIAIQAPNQAMTVEDARALEHRREEFREQLRDAQRQRREVASELTSAVPEARPGLQQRLNVIDERIVQLETGITMTGQQIASLPGDVVAEIRQEARNERQSASNEEEEMLMLGLFLGATGVALIAAYRGWRRRRRERKAAGALGGGMDSDRFTRLEQAVDAIAVEVERIAEGQRFTAKLMSESHDRAQRDVVARDSAPRY